MVLSDGGTWNWGSTPVTGGGAPVLQIQPPQRVMGNPLLGHPCLCQGWEGRKAAPSSQKVGISIPKIEIKDSILNPSTGRAPGWIQPCLRELLFPEKDLGLWKITSPITVLSPLEGSAKTRWFLDKMCVIEGTCGESRENPSEGRFWQPGSSSTGPLECAFCSSEHGKPQGLSGEAIPLGTISLPLLPNTETSDFTTFP